MFCFCFPCTEVTLVASDTFLVSVNPTSYFESGFTLLYQPPFGLLYQPRMMDDDEWGSVGGINGRGNLCTQRKPAPVLLCRPQIPHDLAWAAAVGNWPLIA
jgi:hypothetical protein